VPYRPKAGRRLVSTVSVLRRGKQLTQGRVFCSATIGKRRLEVRVHRLSAGEATCVWQVPGGARGKLIAAAMGVRTGDVRVRATFRTFVS
jgi:hypothetical protein